MPQILKLAEGLWGGPWNKQFCQVPELRLGQASSAPVAQIRYDRKDGFVLSARDEHDAFIRAYASSSPEIEKKNYVIRVCADLKISFATPIKTLL